MKEATINRMCYSQIHENSGKRRYGFSHWSNEAPQGKLGEQTKKILRWFSPILMFRAIFQDPRYGRTSRNNYTMEKFPGKRINSGGVWLSDTCQQLPVSEGMQLSFEELLWIRLSYFFPVIILNEELDPKI